MADPLEEVFRVDVGTTSGAAAILADLARDRMSRFEGAGEDSPEDLAVRLRDPRVFGQFAEPLLRSRRIDPKTKTLLAEHAFDLLPLPRTEGEVFLVEARAPRRLLAIAGHLLRAEAFTLLHMMHLLYAVFLDRGLVTGVGRTTRSEILQGVIVHADVSPTMKSLYAGMHLAAVPEREAAAELRRLLGSTDAPDPVRRELANSAVSADGGLERFARIAQKEGLLPEDADETVATANVPRLPSSLATIGRIWLDRRRTRS